MPPRRPAEGLVGIVVSRGVMRGSGDLVVAVMHGMWRVLVLGPLALVLFPVKMALVVQ